MKKVLFAIFAHPDDEAFGPSGTLLKLKSEGYDIHLILLTDGDAGMNVDNVSNLAAVRLDEWYRSAKILEATSTHALHYPDGEFQSTDKDTLTSALTTHIQGILSSYPETPALSFMTFEPNGLTSHHDHIVASHLATTLAANFSAKEIWYFCLDKTQAPLDETRYYHPKAREDSYITDRIDVSTFLDKKLEMIDAHISQRNDAENMKKLDLSTECFHIDSFSSDQGF